MNIYQRLKQLRKDANMSSEEVAKRIGCSSSLIRK
ncbi:MAG: helix-turn-helix domain-containing protein [Clostridium sp.]|nr:helix-turn-helix domain-containing protein [Clostridium sp.]